MPLPPTSVSLYQPSRFRQPLAIEPDRDSGSVEPAATQSAQAVNETESRRVYQPDYQLEIGLPSHTPIGATVAMVPTGGVVGSSVTFTLDNPQEGTTPGGMQHTADGRFALDPMSGIVRLTGSLDRGDGLRHSFSVTVRASDPLTGAAVPSGSARVTVNVVGGE